MSRIYDDWERLVDAVLKKEQLWQLFHAPSRSPSILSEASDFSSTALHDDSFDFASPGSSSPFAMSQNALSKLVLVSDFTPAFDDECMFLDSCELLGRGTFGSAYKVVMDNGVTIVVKKVRVVGFSELEFRRNIGTVGNIKHENVLTSRAYYSFENEILILYDYYSTRSVHSLLHGMLNSITSVMIRAQVDWEIRLRIAIGAAKGIAEIHTKDDGKLVHGNIKASNMFLNSQHYGCVSDLGFANIIATTFKSSGRCYAPEVENTRIISQASDVYSFGILLLELLTRKSPVDVHGGPHAADLVKLVTSLKSKVWAANVYDSDLLMHPALKDQIVKVLQIGVSCVAKSPKKRPKMLQVVKMLEHISIKTKPIPGSLQQKLVVFGNDYPEFDLEDMLRASPVVLGEGTFGTCYKVTLESGNRIVVKRLKNVNVTPGEFQHHMEGIGRLRHKFIVQLKAYHFLKDQLLLVYDYYHEYTAYHLLHGKPKSGKLPLDWETRLKIAVSAARGIAHIHRQCDGTLVHGNIKMSNLFTKVTKFGLVSEAGLAKVMSPITVSSMRNRGYYAPEVTSTSKVSQPSDVYSFGVLLLELVSGKPSQFSTMSGKVISLVEWIRSVSATVQVFDKFLMSFGTEEEAMVQLLQIAMDCVTTDPDSMKPSDEAELLSIEKYVCSFYIPMHKCSTFL